MKFTARISVVVGSLAWVSAVVAVFTSGAYGFAWWISLGVFLAAWVTARVASHDVAERPSGEVDEYESIQRARARGAGYWAALIGGVAVFVVLTLFVAEARDGRYDLLMRAPDLLIVTVFAVAALPTFVLAWPERIDED